MSQNMPDVIHKLEYLDSGPNTWQVSKASFVRSPTPLDPNP